MKNSITALAINMSPIMITVLIILAVVLVALIVLSILGRRMQKKSEDSHEKMEAAAQTVSLLVIDKKRMKLKEAGLPQLVIDQTPRYLRGSKVPVVKAKIGPKIMTLMCDEKIFPLLPVKKEIKAVLSGIYIMDVKGSRNNLEAPKVKQKFFARMKSKITKKEK